MKHIATPSPKEPTASCIRCSATLAITMLRQVTLEPKYVCRNEAACRKRQRQRAMKTNPTGAKRS